MPSQNGVSVPTLKRVDVNDFKELIRVIKADGAAIITNFTTTEVVDQVNKEVKPHLDADVAWKGKLFPPETRRCTRLVGRSKACRENWLIHPTVTKLTEYFLDDTSHDWYNDELYEYTSHPILNISMTLEVNPGNSAQRLHRDDRIHHNKHTDQTQSGYVMGSDTSFGFLIPGTTTTVENGATLVIPGSHLWGPERAPTQAECGYATMVPGEALAFLGGVYHGGGSNVTQNVKRPVHLMFFIKGILRAEENQYLAYSRDEVLSWPSAVQTKVGFDVSAPNLGFVDFLHPIDFLKGDKSLLNSDYAGNT